MKQSCFLYLLTTQHALHHSLFEGRMPNSKGKSKLETLRQRHGSYIPVFEIPCKHCEPGRNVARPCHYSPSGYILMICPVCWKESVTLLKNWPVDGLK